MEAQLAITPQRLGVSEGVLPSDIPQQKALSEGNNWVVTPVRLFH